VCGGAGTGATPVRTDGPSSAVGSGMAGGSARAGQLVSEVRAAVRDAGMGRMGSETGSVSKEAEVA
jgi:hypothetical protein